MKILMNAEAFGFGPSALIANLYSCMTENQDFKDYQIDYAGTGHSLDLQRKLNYQNIHEITDKEDFQKLVKNYDLFITALDFEKASWARDMQVQVIVYDNLTWYWRKFPNIVHDCHYIAQNFYGVKQRLQEQQIENYTLVAPLLKPVQQAAPKNRVLINFGGLENPLWKTEVTVNYMKHILEALLPALLAHFALEEIVILASNRHRLALSQYPIQTLSYQEVQDLLPGIRYSFATPGLGNMYDSASFDIPTCFLPPANDSQGWQLDILKKENMVDSSFDWSELFEKIDYTAPQKIVLGQIHDNIIKLERVHGLSKHFEEKITELKRLHKTGLVQLIDDFGLEGSTECLRSISRIIENMKELV